MKGIKAVLFWLASWTWGILATLIGFIIALALLITGHRPRRFHYFIYFEIGYSWGGFSCGVFIFTDKDGFHLPHMQHEAGHGIQNIIFGIFWPLIIGIPSAVRYWYRNWICKHNKEKYHKLPPYDSIWFESWASQLGSKHFIKQ